MREFFSPTKSEREAILSALRTISDLASHDRRVEQFAQQEHRGYGSRADSVPLIAAKGLCVTWFWDGLDAPDTLLRDFYFVRPAAIYFRGLGADKGRKATLAELETLRLGRNAYNAAFTRMLSARISNPTQCEA